MSILYPTSASRSPSVISLYVDLLAFDKRSDSLWMASSAEPGYPVIGTHPQALLIGLHYLRPDPTIALPASRNPALLHLPTPAARQACSRCCSGPFSLLSLPRSLARSLVLFELHGTPRRLSPSPHPHLAPSPHAHRLPLPPSLPPSTCSGREPPTHLIESLYMLLQGQLISIDALVLL